MNLENKTVIVTGGAAGIGEGLAERFANQGARHVAVVDLDLDASQAVADRIGGSAHAVDVSDEAAIQELVRTVEADHGGVDLFVSNAGYVTVGGLETPDADLQRMWEVHVLAHIYAARAVIPGMVERGGGYLLNTASAAGLLSQIGSLHYSITKHAAVALAEWLAITHGPQGIRVSVLCPQAVRTKILDNSPSKDQMEGGPRVASGDGDLMPSDVADCVMEALREERFWVLPHAEVAEYARRKAGDVDRWLGGMQRFQAKLFEGRAHPGEWLTGDQSDSDAT